VHLFFIPEFFQECFLFGKTLERFLLQQEECPLFYLHDAVFLEKPHLGTDLGGIEAYKAGEISDRRHFALSAGQCLQQARRREPRIGTSLAPLCQGHVFFFPAVMGGDQLLVKKPFDRRAQLAGGEP